MNRLYAFTAIWLVLAAAALVGVTTSAPVLLVLVIGWCGGVISAFLVNEVYKYQHQPEEITPL